MAQYGIAGLTVEMDVSGRTSAQAEPYRLETPAAADMVLQCDPELIMRQNPGILSAEEAQYMGTGLLFARKLLEHRGIQLHASCVLLDGQAYLFSAPSGTGKSTHTEKWCRLFGAQHLNDDKPALRRLEQGWYAYGTPWSGKHDLSRPECGRIKAIGFLQRGQENTICRLEAGEAVPMIMSQCLRLLNAQQMEKQLQLLDQLLQEVPVYLLKCRNEDEAALVAYAAMTAGEG